MQNSCHESKDVIGCDRMFTSHHLALLVLGLSSPLSLQPVPAATELPQGPAPSVLRDDRRINASILPLTLARSFPLTIASLNCSHDDTLQHASSAKHQPKNRPWKTIYLAMGSRLGMGSFTIAKNGECPFAMLPRWSVHTRHISSWGSIPPSPFLALDIITGFWVNYPTW